MPTGWVLLEDGCLLDCVRSISMPADLLSLNTALCWRCASLSAIPAGMVSHYQPCLLVLCFIIGHAFSFGVSLSAMPVGVVPHYRSCLLVWRLTVGHVFWCGDSLYAMPVGVVPYFTPCLLVRFAHQLTFWLVECRRKKDHYKSGATLTEVPLHQICLLIQCHSQICLLVQCNSIRHACWVHLFRNTCFQSASPSGKKSSMLKINQTCLQVRCGSHGFVKFMSYHPGRHLEYIKFWVMH